uniref:BZIP domain-containing protein n=1 Tax=Strongyloides papillosus TaxID=174720 RepID=A0A0N5C140_STREA
MIETMSNAYSPISSYNLSMGNSKSPDSINHLIHGNSSPNVINSHDIRTSSPLNNYDYPQRPTFSPRNNGYSSPGGSFNQNTNDQNRYPTPEHSKKSKLARNIERWKARNEASKQKYKNSLYFDVTMSRANIENVTKAIIEEKMKKKEEEKASNCIQERTISSSNENKNFNGHYHIQNKYHRQVESKNNEFRISMNNMISEQQTYQASNSYFDFQKYTEHNYKAMLNLKQQVYQNQNSFNGVPLLNLPPMSMNNNPNQMNHNSNFMKNQCFDNDKDKYSVANNIHGKNEHKLPTEGMIQGQYNINQHNNFNMMNSNNGQQMKNYQNIYMNYQQSQNMFHQQNMGNPNSMVPMFQPYVNIQQPGGTMDYLNNRNNY